MSRRQRGKIRSLRDNKNKREKNGVKCKVKLQESKTNEGEDEEGGEKGKERAERVMKRLYMDKLDLREE